MISQQDHSSQVLDLSSAYPLNPDLTLLGQDFASIVAANYHKSPGYTDSNGNQQSREYFAEKFGVRSDDVFLAPNLSMARWYLCTLFLDENDAVACNEGLQPEVLKVKGEDNFRVVGLDQAEEAKLVLIRTPDVDSEEVNDEVVKYATGIGQKEEKFGTKKAIAIEEPFVLLDKEYSAQSVKNQPLPKDTPIYILTSLNEVLLNDSSSFAILILLNNNEGKFDELNRSLLHISTFYDPPNTALHTHTSLFMPTINQSRCDSVFKAIENRKHSLAKVFSSKELKCQLPPPLVFKVGVPRTAKLSEAVSAGKVKLPYSEQFNSRPFVYVSALYSDSQFARLIEHI
jgi:hypothetical protein